MFKASTIIVIAFSCAVASCASIVSKSTYSVNVDSSPSNATFSIINEQGRTIHTGMTPASVTLDAGDGYFSKANYQVRFQKNGYATQTRTLSPSVDGWYVGNILFGGLIGLLIVDPITGAMYKLPSDVSASMQGPAMSFNGKDDNTFNLQVLKVSDLTEMQREQLVLIN